MPIYTVSETRAFQRQAAAAGMTETEIMGVVTYLAANPMAGDELAGTGGCRKLRVAGRGKGKSGGYRVITFFTGTALPVFLLAVFAKGDRANLSPAERNGLARLTAEIVAAYRGRVTKARG